jgi:hypothetical protein
MGEEGPEVRESDYVGTTRGPDQDTESYYKRTPAPGSRTQEWRDAPEGPKDHESDGEPGWISRSAVHGTRASEPTFKVPWLALLFGAGVLTSLSIIVVGVLLLLFTSAGGTPPAPAVEEEPESWQGLRVKKGLR